MKQDFTIAGPFGELSGVINLCEEEAKRRNVLVMAHGFRGSMDGGGRAIKLAEELSQDICSVVRFNFTWCTMLSNQIVELKAVLDFVRETLKPEKLFLLGRSFGGATSIIVACEDNTYRPDGLVLWSAPNSLKSTFVQVLGEDAFQAALQQGKAVVLDDERGRDEIPPAFVSDLMKYDVAELLKKWQSGPLLILHGEKDCIVTPDQAKTNLEIAGGIKELHYLEGDNHHLDLRCKEAIELVKNWMKKNI